MGFTYLAYYAQTFSLQEFLWVVDDPMDYALKFGGGIYAILPMPGNASFIVLVFLNAKTSVFLNCYDRFPAIAKHICAPLSNTSPEKVATDLKVAAGPAIMPARRLFAAAGSQVCG